jgi:hypothetical protein
MKNNTQGLINSLLREIELINESKIIYLKELSHRVLEINQRLDSVRNDLELENRHIIGKKAIGISMKTEKEVKVTCSGVKCCDDFNIKPLFVGENGQILKVLTYEWI